MCAYAGSKCEPNEVQCGWDTFDCVSTLGLCDGHQDCYNGWDESEKTCSREYIHSVVLSSDNK